MAKNTIRALVVVHLHELLVSTTASLRIASVDKNQRLSNAEVAEIHKIIGSELYSLTSSSGRAFLRVLSIVTKSPEIESIAAVSFPPFTVVVLELNKTNHRYPTSAPIIITHGSRGHALHVSGALNDSVFNENDKPRLATDKEIEDCIRALTDAQWKSILTDPLFNPVVTAALDTEIEIPKKRSKKEKAPEFIPMPATA